MPRLSGHSLAQTSDTADGRIAAKGVATRYVAADVLEIEFEITTEAASFTAAKAVADDLQKRLEEAITSENLGALSLDYDFGLLKQQSVYFKKGSKLEHRITATIRELEPSSLHGSVAKVIDRALNLDPRLTIRDVRSSMSEEKTATVERELLEEAVKNARSNAEVIAAAAGLRIVRPLAVYSTPVPEGPFGMAEMSVPGRFYANVGGHREGFKVDGSLAPTIKLSVQVTGVFAVASP